MKMPGTLFTLYKTQVKRPKKRPSSSTAALVNLLERFAAALGVARASDPPNCLRSQAFVLFQVCSMNPQWDGKLRCAETIA